MSANISDWIGFSDLLTRILPGSVFIMLYSMAFITEDFSFDFSIHTTIILIILSFITGEVITYATKLFYHTPTTFKLAINEERDITQPYPWTTTFVYWIVSKTYLIINKIRSTDYEPSIESPVYTRTKEPFWEDFTTQFPEMENATARDIYLTLLKTLDGEFDPDTQRYMIVTNLWTNIISTILIISFLYVLTGLFDVIPGIAPPNTNIEPIILSVLPIFFVAPLYMGVFLQKAYERAFVRHLFVLYYAKSRELTMERP